MKVSILRWHNITISYRVTYVHLKVIPLMRGDEFRWFQTNMAENFIYIDQVAVHPQYRDRGMAESMYKDLENYALTRKIHILVCEVNFIPRNAVSLSFHKKLGFREIGRMQVRGITVSLMQNTMHNPDG